MSETPSPTPTATPTPTPYLTAVETHIDLVVIPPGEGSNDVRLIIRLLDVNGNPVPNKTIKIYNSTTNGDILIGSGVTDSNGYVYATYNITNCGCLQFHAVFEGDSDYAPSETYAAQPVKFMTRIIATAYWESTSSVKLVARLIDVNGNPIPGREIDFWVGNTQIGSATTDDNGYASITYNTTKDTTFMVSFSGDGVYDGSRAIVEWNAPWFTTSVSLSVVPSGSGLTLTARLTDTNGNPLSGKTIKFGFWTQTGSYFDAGSVTTDNNGYATITFNNNSSVYDFIADFEGDYASGGVYGNSYAKVRWDPQKISTNIELFVVPVGAGVGAKLIARLTDSNGNPLSGRTISFYAGDTLIGTATTDDNGYATYANVYKSINDVAFEAKFDGDNNYAQSEAVVWFVPNGTTSIDLTVTPNLPGNVNITARLLDADYNPVSYEYLTFYINGSQIGSASTDINGYASITYNVNPGAWEFSAQYGGHGAIKPSSAYVIWESQKIPTYTDFVAVPVSPTPTPTETSSPSPSPTPSTTPTEGGYSLNLVARLLDYNGNPISGKTMWFYAYDPNTNNWYDVGSATTDDNGYATIVYNDVSTPIMLEAYFEGDDYYYFVDTYIWWTPASIPTPSPTPTETPTPTPTPTESPSPTPTPTPTPTEVPTPTPTPTPTESPSPSPTPTETPTPTPTPTESPSPTPTPTPTETPTPTPTPTETPTPTPTLTPSPSPSPSPLPSPTPTPTVTPIPIPSPTPTQECQPIIRTGVELLDRVVFCIWGYGITVFIILVLAAISALFGRDKISKWLGI